MDRRAFLRTAGLSALLAAGCARRNSPSADTTAARAGTASAPAAGDGGAEAADAASGRARVVLIKRQEWKSPPTADSLRSGLAKGIVALTGASDAAAAWRSLFQPDENVAIKVNCLAGPSLSSSPALAAALTAEMVAAGHDRARLWIYDRTSAELEQAGYTLQDSPRNTRCLGSDEVGYEPEVTLTGDVGTWFSLIVKEWADALINLPVAKDHDLAGISGALKNHFGSISNPNKLHMPDISAAIADVAAAPPIADKQRLVVYDALRVCYDGGPGFKPATTVPYGAVLLSRDPVAADAVVISILDKLRQAHGLQPLASRDAAPTHVRLAADKHGLGEADLEAIEVVEV
ncbi:MAG: DUF362 domain-containing protein [Armatimonadetes bacterium]|nr:DUF362 domain-containing protein [Armatimonadota bacterium]